MRANDEEYNELIRLRHQAEYWREQCARVEEEERALREREKQLEAQLHEQQKRLKEVRAVEGRLRFFVRLLENLWRKRRPERGSSESAQ